ncbi:hypothetical protein N9248_02515 [bacterium]|nr:hypothetical protein [bacterium]
MQLSNERGADLGSEIDEHWFSEHYQHEPADSPVDFVSRDGATILEVQAKPQGMRGLYSGLMQLAVSLSQRPEARTGVLVMDGSRISKERISNEWDQLRELFAPKISKRLSMIVIRDGEHWKQRDNPSIDQLAEGILADEELGFRKSSELRKIEQTSKKAEIFKVLIVRWLMSKGPIGIGELGQHVGCSYPTVRKSLDSIPASESGLREGDISHFPKNVWQDVLTLTKSDRQSIQFVDRSGQRPNPESLIKRLDRNQPKHVAFGGVVAARHWHADFDLNGTPRIDLLVHCPNQILDLSFIQKLDPALKENTDEKSDDSPTVVVHPITRLEPDFTTQPNVGLPLADPVETALDLIDMGLNAQANDLFGHLRTEVRFA